PNLDAYGQVGHWQRLPPGHLDAEANEPPASLALGGYRLDRRLERQRSMPLELEIAHTLQVQAAGRTQSAAVAPTRPGERIVAQTRMETRIARLLLACRHTPEERGEGLVDAAQHVLASREVGHAY